MKSLNTFLITFFLVVNQTQAQTISDPNFAAAIAIACPSCITGNQLQPAARNLTDLDVSLANIASLTGIEGFLALRTLNCRVNQLTSLPPLPASLTFLDCGNNQLLSLPLLPAPLTDLACNNNQLTNLPLLPASLTDLECHNNQLTRLPPLPKTLKLLMMDVAITCIPNEVAGLAISDQNFTPLTLPICSVLPITLLNFTGKTEEDGNLLAWQTANETQNKGFDIERSNNGVRFEKIGFVAGNGTTNQVQAYSFADGIIEGTTYYRLKQLDVDGGFEYSKVIAIYRNGKTALKVFPNPSSGLFNVSGLQVVEGQIYTLTNSAGQTSMINVQNNRQIDLWAYPAGVYYLRIVPTGQVLKLVKE